MWSSGLGIQRQQLRFDPWSGNLRVLPVQSWGWVGGFIFMHNFSVLLLPSCTLSISNKQCSLYPNHVIWHPLSH